MSRATAVPEQSGVCPGDLDLIQFNSIGRIQLDSTQMNWAQLPQIQMNCPQLPPNQMNWTQSSSVGSNIWNWTNMAEIGATRESGTWDLNFPHPASGCGSHVLSSTTTALVATSASALETLVYTTFGLEAIQFNSIQVNHPPGPRTS